MTYVNQQSLEQQLQNLVQWSHPEGRPPSSSPRSVSNLAQQTPQLSQGRQDLVEMLNPTLYFQPRETINLVESIHSMREKSLPTICMTKD